MTAHSPRAGIRVSWPTLVAVLALGLFYAYDLFEAASNLFGVTAQLSDYNTFAQQSGLAERSVPWAILIANLLLAPVGFILALLIGRGRNLATRVLLLVLGLCVTGAVSLSLAAFI